MFGEKGITKGAVAMLAQAARLGVLAARPRRHGEPQPDPGARVGKVVGGAAAAAAVA